ncbi:YrrS family protein [Bacillus tianshenii]|nr:YrrS family protein [Bacillus tianshenii]
MPQEQSRYQQRTQGKKSSKLMYIFAGFFAALLLLFMVSFFVGSGKDSEFVYGPTTPDSYKDDKQEEQVVSDDEKDKKEDKSSEDEADSKNKSEKDADKENEDDVEVTRKPSDKENVNEVITGDWKPVETNQQGNHVTSYEKGSKDWNEMLQAVERATGLSQDEMVVWWLGNGGSPNSSTATVSPEDKSQTYRVLLQWVEGQGWKPVRVETLKQNPHG